MKKFFVVLWDVCIIFGCISFCWEYYWFKTETPKQITALEERVENLNKRIDRMVLEKTVPMSQSGSIQAEKVDVILSNLKKDITDTVSKISETTPFVFPVIQTTTPVGKGIMLYPTEDDKIWKDK